MLGAIVDDRLLSCPFRSLPCRWFYLVQLLSVTRRTGDGPSTWRHWTKRLDQTGRRKETYMTFFCAFIVQ